MVYLSSTLASDFCLLLDFRPSRSPFDEDSASLKQSSVSYATMVAPAAVGASCPCHPSCMELNAYGSTETSPVSFMGFPHDSSYRRTQTSGFIASHTEAKIVCCQTGAMLPLDTPGELWVRGYCVMLGYWNDEEKTKETITPENWYKTGDIATMDKFGYCKIVGRSKDMIIRGGENIYPAEIEQLLHTHPKIHEAQVVGVPDERMGEELCACLRLRQGQECTVEEVKAFCKGKISHYKIPRYVLFQNTFPLTLSGKVQKYKLREMVEKKLTR